MLPNTAKIAFSALVALLITPTIPALDGPLPQEGFPFAVMGLAEAAVGVAMGLVLTMVFAAVQVGGQIMDLQTGFGMMNIFNPTFESQFPVFGFVLFLLAVLYMLAFGWHHYMVKGLVDSYRAVPLGGVVFRPEAFLVASRWGHAMFVDGLMIAAPVAAAMVMAYATLGLLGRVVPQIQLFVIGFPITISLGLFLTGCMIGVYLKFLDGAFYRSFQDAMTLVRGMG